MLWAILIGLVIGNTVEIPKVFQAGIGSYEFFLKAGIVLLGARFLLGDVLKLGGISLALVAVELALSIAFMSVLGKLFGLSPKLTSLLAVGSSICGVSAIIAAQGAIEADDEDASYAIAAILALGAISLFVFPLVGHTLHLSDHAYGLWAGLAVDNTAEATAAGALYSDAAGKVAVLAKTTRNATIGFVVLGFALYYAARGGARQVENKAAFLWRKFPKFVLGFLLISGAGDGWILQQGAIGQPGESVAMGVLAYVRRCWVEDELQAASSTRYAATVSGSDWRDCDRGDYAGDGVWRGEGVRVLRTTHCLHCHPERSIRSCGCGVEGSAVSRRRNDAQVFASH